MSESSIQSKEDRNSFSSDLSNSYDKFQTSMGGIVGKIFVSAGFSFITVWNVVKVLPSFIFVDLDKISLFYILILIVGGITFAFYDKIVQLFRWLIK